MKVVVVGAGMVGNRFVDELGRIAPDVDVDLLGEESYEPYNRVLLTELVAGRVDLAGSDSADARRGEGPRTSRSRRHSRSIAIASAS